MANKSSPDLNWRYWLSDWKHSVSNGHDLSWKKWTELLWNCRQDFWLCWVSHISGIVSGTTFFWRFRYRIQGDYDFWRKKKKYLKAIVYDELMINAGKEVVNNVFDQNRIYVGLQYGINSSLALELGYLNSFQQRASGFDYFNRNIIRLGIYHKLKI